MALKRKTLIRKPERSPTKTVKTVKKAKTTKLNPAEIGLTTSQNEVYCIVRSRQAKRLVTTSSDVAEDWGGKNRSHVYRVLKVLTDKGLVVRYDQRYYKLNK